MRFFDPRNQRGDKLLTAKKFLPQTLKMPVTLSNGVATVNQSDSGLTTAQFAKYQLIRLEAVIDGKTEKIYGDVTEDVDSTWYKMTVCAAADASSLGFTTATAILTPRNTSAL